MHVLVVQDSAADRRALRSLVEQLGHVCEEAADGTEAWARLSRGPYDAIFVDATAHSMGAPELCRRIHQRAGSPYVFTVVCTTVEDRPRGLDAVRAGADLFLTTPLDALTVEMCLIVAARVVAAQRQLAQTES